MFAVTAVTGATAVLCGLLACFSVRSGKPFLSLAFAGVAFGAGLLARG